MDVTLRAGQLAFLKGVVYDWRKGVESARPETEIS